MATQALDQQRMNSENKLKADIAAQVLAEANAVAGLDEQQKRALFENTMDKVISLRTMWLDHMRKLKEQQTKKTITLAEEAANIALVDAKLIAQHHWLDNYKFESDEIPKPVPTPAAGFDGVLQGMLSKLTGALGDGPFAFIGKLLTQIFSFIFPMISAFKEMGKKTTADLIKEGSLEEADAELTMQENELMKKISTTIPNAPETKNVYEALVAYQDELKKLKEVEFTDDNGVHEGISFAETTRSYQTNILTSRLKIFNELSSKTAAALTVHEELVVAREQQAMWQRQSDALAARRANRGVCPKGSAESKLLKVRINAIQTEMNALAAKRGVAEAQENIFLNGMATETKHIQDLFAQNAALSTAEAKRQKDLAAKEKTEVADAKRQAEQKHAAEMQAADQKLKAEIKAAADADVRAQREHEAKMRATAAQEAQAQREHDARMNQLQAKERRKQEEHARQMAAHAVPPPFGAAPPAPAAAH